MKLRGKIEKIWDASGDCRFIYSLKDVDRTYGTTPETLMRGAWCHSEGLAKHEAEAFIKKEMPNFKLEWEGKDE